MALGYRGVWSIWVVGPPEEEDLQIQCRRLAKKINVPRWAALWCGVAGRRRVELRLVNDREKS
jgi:hypothetical protein